MIGYILRVYFSICYGSSCRSILKNFSSPSESFVSSSRVVFMSVFSESSLFAGMVASTSVYLTVTFFIFAAIASFSLRIVKQLG